LQPPDESFGLRVGTILCKCGVDETEGGEENHANQSEHSTL
jgi:hypothetical protein